MGIEPEASRAWRRFSGVSAWKCERKSFSAANGGWEYPVFLIVVSLVQALLGDGKYALTLTKETYA